MALPFTPEQFFDVFAAYHAALWPAPLVANALGLVAMLFLFFSRRSVVAGMVISSILALLWAWSGVAYHLVHFSPINPLAPLFGALFVLAALLFAWHGVVRRRLVFGIAANARSAFGLGLLLYALLVYPLLTTWLGHAWPALPSFGLPCPTALFTLGLLALAQPPMPRAPWLVPIAWAFVGATAAVLLGVVADLALLPAGLAGVALLLWRRFSPAPPRRARPAPARR
jgi:Family of unknown function (DUF6064)